MRVEVLGGVEALALVGRRKDADHRGYTGARREGFDFLGYPDQSQTISVLKPIYLCNRDWRSRRQGRIAGTRWRTRSRPALGVSGQKTCHSINRRR